MSVPVGHGAEPGRGPAHLDRVGHHPPSMPGGRASRPPTLGGMLPRPVPEPIAPGQESVWDYPRPPAIRASDEQIVIVLGGVEICETTTSWRVLETSHPPTYYLPRAAFRAGALVSARRALVLRVEGPGVLPGRGRRGQGRAAGGAGTTPARAARTRPCAGMSPCTRRRWTAAWSTGSVVAAAAGRVLRRLDHLSREWAVQGGSGQQPDGSCRSCAVAVSAAMPPPQIITTTPVSSPIPAEPRPRAPAGRRSARPAPDRPSRPASRRPPRPAAVEALVVRQPVVRHGQHDDEDGEVQPDLDNQQHRAGAGAAAPRPSVRPGPAARAAAAWRS